MDLNKERTLGEIRQLKELLESEKQEFLSVMSHELRTPMTGVKGYLSMILDGDAGEVSPEVKEYVAQAYTANDRLIRLVDRILQIAKLKEGQFQFNISQVDFGRETLQVVKDCQIRADEKKIDLRYEPPKGQVFIKGDPDRVREILLTLVVNATKFTPEGGRIIVTHRETDHMAVVDVKDTGIGIGKLDQERIFQLFTKGNLTLTGQQRGTGIGLYLARQLAEAQGGHVWLEYSEPDKGSTFSMSMPKY